MTHQHWYWILITCCLVCFAVASVSLLPDARSAFQMRRNQHEVNLSQTSHQQWFQENRRLDPKPGQQLILPKTDALGSRLQLESANELLFVGSCSDCILSRVDVYLKTRKPDATRLFLIVQLPKYGTLALGERLSSKGFRLVSDPDGTLHQAFHAFYTPRWYVVSDKGTLIDIQSEQALTPSGSCIGCPK
jgi:hypothetical protein